MLVGMELLSSSLYIPLSSSYLVLRVHVVQRWFFWVLDQLRHKVNFRFVSFLDYVVRFDLDMLVRWYPSRLPCFQDSKLALFGLCGSKEHWLYNLDAFTFQHDSWSLMLIVQNDVSWLKLFPRWRSDSFVILKIWVWCSLIHTPHLFCN